MAKMKLKTAWIAVMVLSAVQVFWRDHRKMPRNFPSNS